MPIWQALHYITIEDNCIGFGFCPPSTPKGKLTAKFRDIYIPLDQVNDCDFVVNALEQLSHDQFEFIDSRKKR